MYRSSKCLQNSGGLSVRKLSETAKRQTTNSPNMLLTRSNEKLKIKWSITEHLGHALKCGQGLSLTAIKFILYWSKFTDLMTVKRSLFLICRLSLSLYPQRLKKVLNTNPAFICSLTTADFWLTLTKYLSNTYNDNQGWGYFVLVIG